MNNDCFWCKQENVHRQLYNTGFISIVAFKRLCRLWHNCEHDVKRVQKVKEILSTKDVFILEGS